MKILLPIPLPVLSGCPLGGHVLSWRAAGISHRQGKARRHVLQERNQKAEAFGCNHKNDHKSAV